MSEPTPTSMGVSQVVFVPTAIAYVFVMAAYLRTGLILYLFFMIAAYWMGLFKRLAEWPVISKITLASGPALIAIGWYVSTQKPAYTMMIPGLVYCGMGYVGAVALRRIK